MAKREMKIYDVYWSPTGQKIASGVRASTAKLAKSKAPVMYRKYKGEMYVVEVSKNPGVRIGAKSAIPAKFVTAKVRRVGNKVQILLNK